MFPYRATHTKVFVGCFWPISRSIIYMGSRDGHEMARVGRPATTNKIVQVLSWMYSNALTCMYMCYDNEQ